MKHKINKELKITLLTSLKNGYLTDADIRKLGTLINDNEPDVSEFLATLSDAELDSWVALLEKQSKFYSN